MLGVLGDEWTLLIVQQALLGARRYAEFAAALPISSAVLTSRLQSMVGDELLIRREYQTRPSRSEYLTTARSRALWPMLTSVWAWERAWVPDHAQPLPSMRHSLCRSSFEPRVACRSCSEPVVHGEVSARWGPTGSWQRSIPASANRRRSPHRRSSAGVLFPQTMSVIGDRWAFALLVAAFVGVCRFTDFQQQLGAPPGTVAARLSTFTAEEILARHDDGYVLTEKGRAFFPVLVCALHWAQNVFGDPQGPAVVLTHSGCGRRFVPVLECERCGERLRGSHIIPVAA